MPTEDQVLMKIKSQTREYKSKRGGYKWKKMDWEDMQELLCPACVVVMRRVFGGSLVSIAKGQYQLLVERNRKILKIMKENETGNRHDIVLELEKVLGKSVSAPLFQHYLKMLNKQLEKGEDET